MQATVDGEFYPEKNLEKSYKIPKRDSGDTSRANNKVTFIPGRRKPSKFDATPLADSYYNYPYDPQAASSYYHYQQSLPGQGYPKPAAYNPNRGMKRPINAQVNNFQKGPSHFLAPPPPPPSNGPGDPIKENIYETLSELMEKPKTYGRNIFEQTAPDILDSTLPKDLKIQFQPLFCKLCSAQLSSNQTAKMHYQSKNHEKKIRKWLIEHSEKTGEPLHPRAVVTGTPKKDKDEESEKNPAWFHCDICDLELTGKLHAESHYMGKNHQKALMGHKTPAGQGYYDESGKWVRLKAQKSKGYNFDKGEDNFGMDFKTNTKESVEKGSVLDEPPAKKKKEPQAPDQFHCDVCNINTTCKDQLEAHFMGLKHLKKLKLFGLENYTAQRKLVEEAVAAVPTSALSTSPLDSEMSLSVYRTPSGDYYCPICNITTNAEPQFLQHMRSKGHAKKTKVKS